MPWSLSRSGPTTAQPRPARPAHRPAPWLPPRSAPPGILPATWSTPPPVCAWPEPVRPPWSVPTPPSPQCSPRVWVVLTTPTVPSPWVVRTCVTSPWSRSAPRSSSPVPRARSSQAPWPRLSSPPTLRSLRVATFPPSSPTRWNVTRSGPRPRRPVPTSSDWTRPSWPVSRLRWPWRWAVTSSTPPGASRAPSRRRDGRSPAASVSAWPWPGRWPHRRRCSFSWNPPAPSTPTPRTWWLSASWLSGVAAPPWWSPPPRCSWGGVTR